MSWVGRKMSMSDDVDHKQVIKEYFEQKQKLLQEQAQAEEVKKFWAEYGDEYYNG